MIIKKILIFVIVILSLITANKVNTWFNIPSGVINSEPTELERFLNHMAERESQNTPTIVNRFGMMGKYQFSPSTVKILGYDVTKNEFLKNSELQDSVMVSYMRNNKRDLRHLLNRYEGRRFKGIVISEAGLLAAAHLGGSMSVIRWFSNSDYNGRTDANGTSIRNYMLEFGKYKLEL